MLKLRLSILLALMLAFYDISARVPGVSDNCVLLRSLVFGGPDSVSKFYRIPALAISSDGAIVAVADRRRDSEGDLPGNIDVVCRRSTDGGQNWSPAITIAACDENGGYGDPALGVDRRSGDLVCVFTHGNGLWNSTPDNHAYIYSCRSSDGGLSWSQPADITPSLFDWYGKAPVKAVTAFASSGGILTCSDGTMWFCLIAKPEQEKWGRLQVYAVRSTDGGHSWQIMPQPVDEDGDDCTVGRRQSAYEHTQPQAGMAQIRPQYRRRSKLVEAGVQRHTARPGHKRRHTQAARRTPAAQHLRQQQRTQQCVGFCWRPTWRQLGEGIRSLPRAFVVFSHGAYARRPAGHTIRGAQCAAWSASVVYQSEHLRLVT